jgi:hypothetical protein
MTEYKVTLIMKTDLPMEEALNAVSFSCSKNVIMRIDGIEESKK